MQNDQELDTVWRLVNLLEKLSDILFDRYQDYIVERYLDEEGLRYFENLGGQSKQFEILSDDPK